MDLIIVRHGQTAWNREKRLQGHLDLPLDATGREQAEAVGRRLKTFPIAAVVSSDLCRAVETAQIALTASAIAHPLATNPQLRERHCGHFQGLTREEAAVIDSDGWARFASRDPYYAPHGGESLADLAERVRSWLVAWTREALDATVLLVTHGGVVDTLRRLVLAIPLSRPRDFTIPNAALFHLRITHPPAPLAHRAGDCAPAAPCGEIVLWGGTDHLATARDELAVM
ncbi:histidine phosphatase family protein [Hydrogenophilus islandicus]